MTLVAPAKAPLRLSPYAPPGPPESGRVVLIPERVHLGVTVVKPGVYPLQELHPGNVAVVRVARFEWSPRVGNAVRRGRKHYESPLGPAGVLLRPGEYEGPFVLEEEPVAVIAPAP